MSDARPPNGRRAGLQWKPRSFEWALIGRPMEETFCDRRQSIRSQRAGGLINDAHILMRDARPPSGCRAGLQWTPRLFDWVLIGRTMEEAHAVMKRLVGE